MASASISAASAPTMLASPLTSGLLRARTPCRHADVRTDVRVSPSPPSERRDRLRGLEAAFATTARSPAARGPPREAGRREAACGASQCLPSSTHAGDDPVTADRSRPPTALTATIATVSLSGTDCRGADAAFHRPSRRHCHRGSARPAPCCFRDGISDAVSLPGIQSAVKKNFDRRQPEAGEPRTAPAPAAALTFHPIFVPRGTERPRAASSLRPTGKHDHSSVTRFSGSTRRSPAPASRAGTPPTAPSPSSRTTVAVGRPAVVADLEPLDLRQAFVAHRSPTLAMRRSMPRDDQTRTRRE
jgi:hypothetical protein